MNEALKAYLAKSDRVEVDLALFNEHLRNMTERVIPGIVDDIQERERLAAELRYSPAKSVPKEK